MKVPNCISNIPSHLRSAGTSTAQFLGRHPVAAPLATAVVGLAAGAYIAHKAITPKDCGSNLDVSTKDG